MAISLNPFSCCTKRNTENKIPLDIIPDTNETNSEFDNRKVATENKIENNPNSEEEIILENPVPFNEREIEQTTKTNSSFSIFNPFSWCSRGNSSDSQIKLEDNFNNNEKVKDTIPNKQEKIENQTNEPKLDLHYLLLPENANKLLTESGILDVTESIYLLFSQEKTCEEIESLLLTNYENISNITSITDSLLMTQYSTTLTDNLKPKIIDIIKSLNNETIRNTSVAKNPLLKQTILEALVYHIKENLKCNTGSDEVTEADTQALNLIDGLQKAVEIYNKKQAVAIHGGQQAPRSILSTLFMPITWPVSIAYKLISFSIKTTLSLPLLFVKPTTLKLLFTAAFTLFFNYYSELLKFDKNHSTQDRLLAGAGTGYSLYFALQLAYFLWQSVMGSKQTNKEKLD